MGIVMLLTKSIASDLNDILTSKTVNGIVKLKIFRKIIKLILLKIFTAIKSERKNNKKPAIIEDKMRKEKDFIKRLEIFSFSPLPRNKETYLTIPSFIPKPEKTLNQLPTIIAMANKP